MRTILLLILFLYLNQLGFSQQGKSGLDTVFCDIQNTTCINFPEEVTLVDVGNPQQYVAKIQGNLVFVKPVKDNVPSTTILIKSGPSIYHGTLTYNKTGKVKPYYYEIKSVVQGEVNNIKKESNSTIKKDESKISVTDTSVREKIEVFSKIKSEIRTLGFISKNVDAAVTVIRNDEKNTYLKLIVKNKSSIPFKLDFISFQYYQDMKKGSFRKSKKAPLDVFPIAEPTIKEIAPDKSEGLPYVIPAYALANNGYLMVLIRESAGDRVLKIKIEGSTIQDAGQLVIDKK
jgi:hypothetical protein